MLARILRYVTPARWWANRGKHAFVSALARNGRVLDVGCGNNSPAWFKKVRPDLYYVGIDIGDYNQAQNPSRFADEYLLTSPEDFAGRIEAFGGQMDAVVSAHNLEHCNEPDRVLHAMVKALKPGGKLYLSFPCEESVRFPHRGGCLNFFDDHTHKIVPSWANTQEAIRGAGAILEFAAKRYRPLPLVLRGLFLEPLSAYRGHTFPDGSTWALYGFESIIWAAVPPDSGHLENPPTRDDSAKDLG
jgi:SAM-dependent methyltransferase